MAPVAPRQFRVLSIVEVEGHIFEITGLLHDPTKYARVEQGIQLDVPSFSALPTGPIGKPTNLTHSEYLYKPAAAVLSAVTFSWSAPNDSRVSFYEVESKPPGGPAGGVWRTERSTDSLSVNIEGTDDGEWSFRVRAVAQGGRKSSWTEYTATLNALGGPPPDVQNFRIKVVGAIATLSWDKVDDLRDITYRIKRSPRTNNPGWGEAVVIEQRIEGSIVQIASNSGTFLIKAFTDTGQQSVNAASITSTIAEVEGLNVVETVEEDPGFTGTKTDTAVVSSQLRLAEQSPDVFHPSGTYNFAGTTDLGAVYTSRVSANIDASGFNAQNVIASWIPLSSVENMSGTTADEWDVEVFVRFTSDDPGGSPTWSAWQPLVIGDYTARAFEFYAALSGISTNITPSIVTLEAQVDMPDRIEAGDDLVVPAAGLRIDFSPVFRVLSGLGTAEQDLADGERKVITNKSRTGL